MKSINCASRGLAEEEYPASGGGGRGDIFLAGLKTRLLGNEGDTFAQIFASSDKSGAHRTEAHGYLQNSYLYGRK